MYLLNPSEPTDPGWSYLNSHASVPYGLPTPGAMTVARARAKRLGHDVRIVHTGGRLARTVHPDGSYTVPAR